MSGVPRHAAPSWSRRALEMVAVALALGGWQQQQITQRLDLAQSVVGWQWQSIQDSFQQISVLQVKITVFGV